MSLLSVLLMIPALWLVIVAGMHAHLSWRDNTKLPWWKRLTAGLIAAMYGVGMELVDCFAVITERLQRKEPDDYL